jgi:hypothetical protein
LQGWQVHYAAYSALAQLVEQLTVNQRVAGSSPAGGAKTHANSAAYDAPHALLWARCLGVSYDTLPAFH